MKTNEHYEDTALRQVMNKQAQSSEGMQLPHGFADRVMKRIHEAEEAEAQASDPFPEKHSVRFPIFRKVAAIFIGTICLSGLAYAAWMQVNETPHHSPTEQVTKADSVTTFKNTPLHTILERVSSHYSRRVSFKNEKLREWRLQITWDPTRPLAEFIELLNEFDAIHVTDMENTIIVESKQKEK